MAKLLGNSGTENPAGTTFVQADSTCFRDLVQRLTGPPVNEMTQPASAVTAPKKPTAELHERRKLQYARQIEIARPATSLKAYQLPSSIMQVSPMSSCSPPVAPYSNKRVLEAAGGESSEEKGTKEKRSYLHPSPRSKPRLHLEDGGGACTVSAQPKLLTLFPLTSPTADAKFP